MYGDVAVDSSTVSRRVSRLSVERGHANIRDFLRSGRSYNVQTLYNMQRIKDSISLELHSARIDSLGRQFITGFCILIGSYFARNAWRSVVMTDRSRLPPRLVWNQSSGQQCYCQKESSVDMFVLRYCPSSNSLCTNMTSLVPRNRNSSPSSLL